MTNPDNIARTIARRVHTQPGITVAVLSHRWSSYTRPRYRAGLHYAKAQGYIIERLDPTTGARRLYPGPNEAGPPMRGSTPIHPAYLPQKKGGTPPSRWGPPRGAAQPAPPAGWLLY